MPRVAKVSVAVPTGVDAKINGQVIIVKDKNGELIRTLNDAVEVKHVGSTLTFSPRDGYAGGWAQAGIARTLPNSMVIGVTEGFIKKLQLVGVGYHAAVKGSVINLPLGFSHPVDHQLPAGITAECPTQIEIVLKGVDEQVVGQVAADLCAYRRPEPYKGKGARYAGEAVHTKEAKKRQGNTMNKKSARVRRTTRARRKLQELGAARLVVHHIPRHIYAQVTVPNDSEVLAVISTVEKATTEQLKYTGNKDAAVVVGRAVARRALEKSIKDVSFDRPGFQYHGRVQALADAARKAGLQL